MSKRLGAETSPFVTTQVDSKASVIFGDGFAMWLTKERAQPYVPSMASSLGPNPLAEELDICPCAPVVRCSARKVSRQWDPSMLRPPSR
jgi:hypothetical protein